MERETERTAFAKACAYLNYSRTALWTAHVAAVGSCLIYVVLLAVLWLFADLMVSRGRLPTFHDEPWAAQDRFLTEWSKLPGEDEARVAEARATALGAATVGVSGDPSGQGPLTAAALGDGTPVELANNERIFRLKLAGYDDARAWRWRPYRCRRKRTPTPSIRRTSTPFGAPTWPPCFTTAKEFPRRNCTNCSGTPITTKSTTAF